MLSVRDERAGPAAGPDQPDGRLRESGELGGRVKLERQCRGDGRRPVTGWSPSDRSRLTPPSAVGVEQLDDLRIRSAA